MQRVNRSTLHDPLASKLSSTVEHSSLFTSSNIADAYSKYRPIYGPEVFEAIVDFCKESSPPSPLALALDVGCGSGQCTVPLARSFRCLIGVDASEEQVAQAPRHLPNVTFRSGKAEDLSFAQSESVDLVTVSQALHWMDRDRLYAEVERVLRPGGAFVVLGYVLEALDRAQAQEAMENFEEVLRPYNSPGIVDLEDRYRSYNLPFPGWRRNDNFVMEKKWSVDEFIGYLSSWSPYHQYLRHHPSSNLLTELKQKLLAAYNCYNDDERELPTMRVTWSVCMLMGHKQHVGPTSFEKL